MSDTVHKYKHITKRAQVENKTYGWGILIKYVSLSAGYLLSEN